MKEPSEIPRALKLSRRRILRNLGSSFLMVNGIAVMAAIAIPNTHRSHGSTMKSHIDPSTGQPVLQALEGCSLRESAEPGEGDEPGS